jgi:hypothetical protein
VALLVDDAVSPHFTHFIDPVGELITAILDMDHGLATWFVAAVHVGDAQGFAPISFGTGAES